MNRKSISLFCAFLVGSIFSLSITLFCDLGMNHKVPELQKTVSSSCHQETAAQGDEDSESCPVLFSLLDAKEGIVKESPRMDSPSYSTELPVAFGHPEISFSAFRPRALDSRPPGMIHMPIYLQNPVLRI